jgi:hypothetical protein
MHKPWRQRGVCEEEQHKNEWHSGAPSVYEYLWRTLLGDMDAYDHLLGVWLCSVFPSFLCSVTDAAGLEIAY